MSEKSIEASRRNGAKSKGPVTARGKYISSQNAVRHGLLCHSVVLDSESGGAFEEFLEAMHQSFEPTGLLERSYVETMAVCRWKQERMWTLEKSTIALEERRQLESNPNLAKDENAPTRTGMAFAHLADNSRSLDLLGRYQTRNDREYERALKRLCELRGLCELRRKER